MNFCILFIIIFLLSSCGYPDIDTVPNFETLTLSKKESIDLCKISNPDKKDLSICLEELDK